MHVAKYLTQPWNFCDYLVLILYATDEPTGSLQHLHSSLSYTWLVSLAYSLFAWLVCIRAWKLLLTFVAPLFRVVGAKNVYKGTVCLDEWNGGSMRVFWWAFSIEYENEFTRKLRYFDIGILCCDLGFVDDAQNSCNRNEWAGRRETDLRKQNKK